MQPLIACLDVWAPAVRDVVRRNAPPGFELEFAQSYDPGHQLDLAARAEVLLPGWAAVTESMLERAARLRMIQKWGIGVDRIDVEAVRRRGIPLSITAGSNAAPVAELAIALMLSVYRRVPYVNRVMRLGEWPKAEMRESCFQLADKTIGVVGFGNIGRMLARRLRGFDVQVLYFDARRADAATEERLHARFVELPELLAQSDIVSLHAPYTPQTERMVNAQSIAGMKDGAVLINTARGELVDEDALYDALRSGKLRGAGLDAFWQEPVPASHPLLTLEQVVVTPHAGGGVFDNVENVARHAFSNITRHFRGEPLAAADVIVAAPAIPHA
jgi:phosphoglycerate dehydrogenase-like enzyme